MFTQSSFCLFSDPPFPRYQAKQAARYNFNPPPEMWLKMGQVGGILTPIGKLYLLCTPIDLILIYSRRTLHYGFHDFQRCPLDWPNHWLNTIWHWRLLRLYLHIHLLRYRLPTNGLCRYVSKCNPPCHSRRLFPTIRKRAVSQTWYGWCYGTSGWTYHRNGTFTVSARHIL